MIKKKLQPFKRPLTNHGQFHSQSNLSQILYQLVKQQRLTNQLLQNKTNLKTKSKIQSSQDSYMSDKRISIKKDTTLRPILQSIVQRRSKIDYNDINNINKQQLQEQYGINSKKTYNILNEFLPYTDRRQYKIRISFENFIEDLSEGKNLPIKELEKITNLWVGDVFRMVASMCWNMLLNGFLNFDQTKILFTENIIYNYIQFMQDLDKRSYNQYKHQLTSLINKTSVNVLDFLGKQFPQTKIQAPNIRLKQIVPKINNSHRLKYDLITLANIQGFQLRYKKSANYSQEIMTFLNYLIDQTNTWYPEYQKDCMNIFQQLYHPINNRCKPDTSLKNLQIYQKMENINYKQKVKKYTKFLIGRKINKNVPKYTREQINNGVFYPKAPSILRIITKWVQQLIDIIKKPQQYVLSPDKQLKSHDGNFVTLFGTLRKSVCNKIIQKRGDLFKKIQAIKQQCFYIQSILSSSKFTQDASQVHLSSDQIAVGKYSVYLQKAISTYIFEQLNVVLHFLLQIPLLVDQKNIGIVNQFDQSEAKKQLDKLNLVTMKIFDLLRCKCISNQQEIIWLMKFIIEKNDIGGDFKLVRVKDRLSQGTRDINMNLRFRKNGLLSEMQLSVVANIQKKQEQLDYYNHFLYQLKRSKLGPLSENVSIWTVLQQRSSYFQKIAKHPIPNSIDFHSCSNENLQKFTRPISCQSCRNFYPYPQICYSNIRCKKCKKSYCGQCYSKILDQNERKQLIFQKIFDQKTLSNIIQHTDPSKPFPLEGIYLKKLVQRKQINFFTVLIRDPIDQHITSKKLIIKTIKNNIQTKYELIFTHNVIREGKIVDKQKNYKFPLIGKFNDKGQLFIDPSCYKFFNQYLIFSFQGHFKSEILTLSEIEDRLKQQTNTKKKVLNIMNQPVYMDALTYLSKRTQKIRQFFYLKQIFEKIPTQKFLTYELDRILILAKAHKDPIQLGDTIDYANNVSLIKQYASTQNSIISMDRRNIRYQFQNIKSQLTSTLKTYLVKNLRKLYLNYNSIPSVQGLSLFTGLQVLYLKHNQIKSLKGLQTITGLIVLRIDDNKIQSLQNLRNLTQLRRLMGNKNKIKSLEPLSKLIGLKTVQFDKNQITNIDCLKNLPQLQQYSFRSNMQLKSVPKFVSDRINFVALSQTGIRDFSFLSEYTRLQRVLLQNLQLTEIPSSLKDIGLHQLWLGFNCITQLNNLQNQTSLQILSLKSNKLSSISNIRNLKQIKTLYFDDNQIISLEGIKNCLQTLRYLSINNNPLTDCKQLAYTDENFVIKYTNTYMSEKAINQIVEILYSKGNSSGNDD